MDNKSISLINEIRKLEITENENKVKNNLNINSKILELNDLNSDEVFLKIKNSVDNKIIEYKGKYWKYTYQRWVKCTYSDCINFLTESFIKYLVDIKNDLTLNLSKNDRKYILQITDKWKNGSVKKEVILEKIFKESLIDEEFLKVNNLITEQKIQNSENNEQVICIEKKENLSNISSSVLLKKNKVDTYVDLFKVYMMDYICYTDNPNDYLELVSINSKFGKWLISKGYNSLDIRVFGRFIYFIH